MNMSTLELILTKLSSRKFLLTVFAIVVLLLDKVPTEYTWEFIITVCSYIAVEGAIDLVSRFTTNNNTKT